MATPAWRALRSGLALQKALPKEDFLRWADNIRGNFWADGTPHSPSRYLFVDD
ncbi:hypothetical protein ACVXG9_24460 [Escherichia coli]